MQLITEPTRKALVVTPHPDDAEFWCAGTVARWISEGASVHYVLCTDGGKRTSDRNVTSQELAATHSDPNIFKRLLPKNFIYNSTKFETSGDINTCWRWCLARCVLAHITLKDFQKLFRQRVILKDTDDTIVLMTLLRTIEHDSE